MESELKARLIEAAIAADRSGEAIKIQVLQSGVRITILREVKGRVMSSNNHTGWTSIEHAVQNPLLLCVRDLINQMNDMRS